MIRDLYDNSIVAYKTAVQQMVSLVLDTIRLAMKNEKKRVAAELQLHSDQGFQYTSLGYFNLTQEYGITPSMSRRGNCYDNAMAENFFSILKTECIYRQKIRSFQQAKELIDDFIYFYNHERIQLKTRETPLAQRLSAKFLIFPTRGLFVLSAQVGAVQKEVFLLCRVNRRRASPLPNPPAMFPQRSGHGSTVSTASLPTTNIYRPSGSIGLQPAPPRGNPTGLEPAPTVLPRRRRRGWYCTKYQVLTSTKYQQVPTSNEFAGANSA